MVSAERVADPGAETHDLAVSGPTGVYLAGGITPSIVSELQKGPFRHVFEEKGRLDLKQVPVYVIMDEYPTFKGCAAALM